MALNDANDFLTSSGGPLIKLNELAVGEIIKAKIIDGDKIQKTDVKTREPLTFADGQPKMQLVLTVQREGVDEEERIFMHYTAEKSLGAVLRDKQLKLEAGGTIVIKRLDDEPNKNKALDPKQHYQCDYAAPTVVAGGLI
jgi:hypothetical protein